MTRMQALDAENAPLTGITLIEASAGTGKTHTIATLFLRMLLETEWSLTQILVVTFTRAATAELRLRIRKRLAEALAVFESDGVTTDPTLGRIWQRAQAQTQTARYKQRLSEALRGFDEAAIFTIHGFCQRVLKRHAFESGMPFETELLEDQSFAIEEVISDFWAERLAQAQPALVAALGLAKVNIDTLVMLVKRVTSNPELRLLPEVEPQAIAPRQAAYAAAGAEVARIWAQSGPEIQRLLAHPDLHKTHYGPGKLNSIFNELLPRAAEVLPGELLASKIKRLTRSDFVVKQGQSAPEHAFFDACEAWLQAGVAMSAALQAQVVAFQHAAIAYAQRELTRRSDESQKLGFDDLLARLSRNLQGSGGEELIRSIRDTHCAALIDEFQDTDPVQCDVFRRIYAAQLPGLTQASLFLIGDPKQAIYAFRGADIFAYMAAARSGVDRSFTLSTNYRSDPSVLRAIDCVFSHAHLPFIFPEIRYRSVNAAPHARDLLQGAGAAFEILVADVDDADVTLKRPELEQQIMKRLAGEIVELLGSDARLDGTALEPRHLAVLCRTNQQAFGVQAALRDVGVAAVLDGDASVFHSSMAEELGRWLWAMVEPSDPARLRAALATTGLGLLADDLLQLEHDEPAWDRHVGDFHAWQELWHAHGFMRAFHALCDERAVPARLLSLPDGERRYTDLMHLAELLHAEALHSRKGPRALLDWYRRMRVDAAQRQGMALQDMQIRLESDAQAVTLTTIHKSKGLQFPIVYCPFLWPGNTLRQAEKESPQFHDPERSDQPTLVLQSPEDKQVGLAEREGLAEQLRLLYVALTRAKHRVSIVWSRAAYFEASALAYVLHQSRQDAAVRALSVAQLAAMPEAERLSLEALKFLNLPNEADSLRAKTQKRVKTATGAELQADLAQLSAVAEGAISVRALRALESATPYRGRLGAAPQLAARTPKRRTGDALQISSFSQLAASERARSWEHDAPAFDRDDAEETVGTELVESPQQSRVALADFPAGATFGHLIHSIYEQLDFRMESAQSLSGHVQGALQQYGAPDTWCEPLAAAVFASLRTPLSAAQTGLPMLASVAREQRMSELEFVFPVAPDRGAQTLLSPERLAAVLSAHARDPAERAYATRLRALRFAPFAGFLRGFVDLVVEHAGRFYIIDYKSNRLGATAADYQPQQLAVSMRRHHYVLQYLVYTLALHRYLERRLPGYSYDEHVGGVYYLFVRGMHPEHPAGTGVFFDRPELALVEQLASVVSAPVASGASGRVS